MYWRRNSPELVFVALCLASFVFHQFANGMFSGFRRSCRNRTADIYDIQLQVSLTSYVDFTNDSFQLFLRADWTADFSNVGGGERPLDGFAVHFLNTDVKYNHSAPNHPIAPTTNCISGPEHFWVGTTEEEACDTGGMAATCEERPPGFCLCPTDNCTLLPNPVRCKGTLELLEEPDYYRTVPSTVRSITYPIDFLIKYDFSITPYYREIANGARETEQIVVADCTAHLLNFTKSREVAEAFCYCEHGVQSLVAQDIKVSEPRPTFRHKVNETTVNVTVTWLPPGTGGNVNTYSIHLGDEGDTAPWTPGRLTNLVNVPLANGSVDNNSANVTACNVAPLYSTQVELYNLVPGKKYRVVITPVFNDTDLQNWCKEARCTNRVIFEAKAPSDLCKKEFNLCVHTATCNPGFDPSTGRNASCVCGPGLSGNGIGGDIGTGCTELDSCTTDQNVCADFALCGDLPAPQIGVNCTCRDGYDGDGLVAGSGCRSRAVVALAIALPLVAVIVIAVIVVWYVKKKRKEKTDALFARYIVDLDNGILMSYLNADAKEDQGPWDPSFGDKWEIDRKNLHFGKVLGRGNYGVVHMAWLSTESDSPGKAALSNGSYRNGDFYNPVISNGNGENLYNEVDANSTVVAVKSLQDSTRNHENVANFLAEIGFMLNVGDHENIVKIYGCSTTEEPVYMVTEYLHYGDLLHFLWDARDPSKGETDPVYRVTELSLCTMARHVAKGMSYLQQIRVIHGDIAARNILVGKEGMCKISDFGLANDVYRYGAIKGHKEKFVPFKWISPERMMLGHVPITSKSDVWSYGNLMYEMFTLGCPPHPGIQPSELLDKLRSGYRMKKPATCNDQIYDLLNKCWQWRASSRPSFAQLVKLLDSVINQLQAKRNELNVVTAVDDLDREQYAHELRTEPTLKENECVNGNIALVENELDSGSRGM